MTLTGTLRAHLYRDGIERCAARYEIRIADSERAGIQLAALNVEWARIAEGILTSAPING